MKDREQSSFDRIRRRLPSEPKGSDRVLWRGNIKPFGDKAANHDTMVRWSIGLGLIPLGVILLAVLIWSLNHDPEEAGDAVDPQVILQDPALPIAPMGVPEIAEAASKASAALALEDPSRVGDYFHPCSTSDSAIIDFLKKTRHADGTPLADFWVVTLDQEGLARHTKQMKTGHHTEELDRIAFYLPDAFGNWKIDFDAYARTTDPSWEQILANPRTGGMVRIQALLGYYYNGIFMDDDWLCVSFYAPELKAPLFGYCRVQTAMTRALVQNFVMTPNEDLRDTIMTKRGKRMTLRIRQPEGALPNQFEITEFVAEDWVVSARDR